MVPLFPIPPLPCHYNHGLLPTQIDILVLVNKLEKNVLIFTVNPSGRLMLRYLIDTHIGHPTG